jgi:hypothetical protein
MGKYGFVFSGVSFKYYDPVDWKEGVGYTHRDQGECAKQARCYFGPNRGGEYATSGEYTVVQAEMTFYYTK